VRPFDFARVARSAQGEDKLLMAFGNLPHPESVRMYHQRALEFDGASFDCALTRFAQDEEIFSMPSITLPHPERSAEGAQSNGRTPLRQRFIPKL
jgi:hypothetical protein